MKLRQVDPKFLRNLKFSKKHNVRTQNKVVNKVAAPVIPAVKAATTKVASK